MHISTKFRIAAIVCMALAAVIPFALLPSPDGNAQAVQAVRTMPAWQFYGFMIVVLALLAFMVKIFYIDLPRAGRITKLVAEQIASQKWYVKGAVLDLGDSTTELLDFNGWSKGAPDTRPAYKGAAVLKLVSVDSRRQPLIIPIRPAHPSIAAVRGLKYLDEVEFNFVEKPLDCALDTEFCAWLVLKT